MAESLKFTNLDEAIATYDDLPWQRDGDGVVSIFDAKADEYVRINEGDYIVSIGDRYEVSESKPSGAKAAEPKKDAAPTVEAPVGAEQPEGK